MSNRANILPFEQFRDKAELCQYVWIELYEGVRNSLDDLHSFHVIKGTDHEDAMKTLDLVNSKFAGHFTAICKSKEKATRSEADKVYLSLNGKSTVPTPIDPLVAVEYGSTATQGDLSQVIANAVAQAMEKQKKEDEVERLQEKLDSFKDGGGKILNLLEMAYQRWGHLVVQQPGGVMQGNEVDEDNLITDPEQIDDDTVAACLVLCNLFGEEGVQVLGKVLPQDANAVTFVRNYIQQQNG